MVTATSFKFIYKLLSLNIQNKLTGLKFTAGFIHSYRCELQALTTKNVILLACIVFYRATLCLCYAIARCLSVCLSVPSVRTSHAGIVSTRRSSLSTSNLKNSNIPMQTPNGDVECSWGIKLAIFDQYLTLQKYGHSYYKMRIKNRTEVFEWYHFQ